MYALPVRQMNIHLLSHSIGYRAWAFSVIVLNWVLIFSWIKGKMHMRVLETRVILKRHCSCHSTIITKCRVPKVLRNAGVTVKVKSVPVVRGVLFHQVPRNDEKGQPERSSSTYVVLWR